MIQKQFVKVSESYLEKDIVEENSSFDMNERFILEIESLLFLSIPMENQNLFYKIISKKYFKIYGLELPGDSSDKVLRRKALNRRFKSKGLPVKIRKFEGKTVLLPNHYKLNILKNLKNWQ